MVEQYNADSIEILEPLEHIRRKVGMYLGSSDVRGLNHTLYEVFDNAVDEAMLEESSADLIKVIINEDGSVTVEDNGRGMPVDVHKTGRPAVELIFLSMNTGGKFDSSSYKTSGGTHGVGLKAVTATSKWVDVEVMRGGKVYHMRIEDQKLHTELEEIGECDRDKTGTRVTYMPDDMVFSTISFNKERVKERLKQAAYINKGLTVHYIDKELGLEEMYEYPEGMVEYLEEIAGPYGLLTDIQKIEVADDETGMKAEIAYVWVDRYDKEHILTFTNSVRNSGGGTSETGFKQAITKAFNQYATTNKKAKEKLDGGDLREGLFAIINVLIPENLVEFEGQTKNKLGTNEARGFTDRITSESVTYLIHNNTKFSDYIINKVVEKMKLRERLRKGRESKTKKKRNENRIDSQKLLEPVDINKKAKRDKMELFICEGKTNENCPSYLTQFDIGGHLK